MLIVIEVKSGLLKPEINTTLPSGEVTIYGWSVLETVALWRTYKWQQILLLGIIQFSWTGDQPYSDTACSYKVSVYTMAQLGIED